MSAGAPSASRSSPRTDDRPVLLGNRTQPPNRPPAAARIQRARLVSASSPEGRWELGPAEYTDRYLRWPLTDVVGGSAVFDDSTVYLVKV
ncbi:MAG: hypothetical protein Kow001_05860 [Acidobacteriota bacterium]